METIHVYISLENCILRNIQIRQWSKIQVADTMVFKLENTNFNCKINAEKL